MATSNMFVQHQHTVKVKAAGVQASTQLASSASASASVQGQPVRLLIPNVGIDVKIVDGTYNPTTQKWTVAHDYANYATMTPQASSTSGTPLIYGHWYDQVLGKTRDLKTGDVAYVYTDNGHILSYRYDGKDVVNPTDTNVLDGLDSVHGLKLMTCEGTFAQHRRIMNFSFEKAV